MLNLINQNRIISAFKKRIAEQIGKNLTELHLVYDVEKEKIFLFDQDRKKYEIDDPFLLQLIQSKFKAEEKNISDDEKILLIELASYETKNQIIIYYKKNELKLKKIHDL